MIIIKRIITITLAVVLILTGYYFYSQNKSASGVVRAFGRLNVTFPGVPMFSEVNWYPGKIVTRSILVENTDLQTRKVGIKAVSINDNSNPFLADILKIIIITNGQIIYGEGSLTGSKTLADFYREIVVWLTDINRNETASYDFRIQMDAGATNNYQGKSTTFDLFVGADERSFLSFPTIRALPTFRVLPTLAPLQGIRSAMGIRSLPDR
ncbi:hypothetical protein A2960_00520 [Candidatus Gottesmanbacteria bacterium RIFCSPLOWO2_01_FULL_39_12b]|uniref:Uncharacterized protein n=1 Tax=Candidatus Gottesmanbacteria bacterium RIFCSPLOWO2_01_FULL_39_12b TaxID=1798388 RepID=A0A1F6APN4_9BACT|nr:MAG: hypothetical protein A2960_00520 [Candidatus Gottesmanbacteria bacterium RIFCSPLOWO2_01_FULL_39_12b]